MTIRFLTDTHIRADISNPATQPIGEMYKGETAEVENAIFRGFAHQQIDQWYHDREGRFYWAGSTEILTPELFGIAIQQNGGIPIGGKIPVAPPKPASGGNFFKKTRPSRPCRNPCNPTGHSKKQASLTIGSKPAN